MNVKEKKTKRDGKGRTKRRTDRQTDRWGRSLALHQINVITALIGQTLDRWGRGEKGDDKEGGDETEGEI